MTDIAVLRRDEPTSGQADLDEVKAAFDAMNPDVAQGATLLVSCCRPTAAFTRRDALLPGYDDACAAALGLGFEPVLRPVGGHLAAYDEGCVVLHLWRPMREAGNGIQHRFARFGAAIAEALTGLGVAEVRVGAVPGEYCEGEWSVNLSGRHKVVGTGQRISRNGYLFSAVATVTGADRLREVLVPTYAALGLDLDPETVGALPGLSVTEVADALVAGLHAAASG